MNESDQKYFFVTLQERIIGTVRVGAKTAEEAVRIAESNEVALPYVKVEKVERHCIQIQDRAEWEEKQ